MKYPVYPEYKESDVKWIGKIPEEWERVGCKYLYFIQLGKMLQNTSETPEDIEIRYLKALHVLWGKTIVDDLQTMFASPRDIQK